MPVFTLQNNPPKGWRRSDPLQEFWGHQEYVWSPPCQQQPCVRHQQSGKCCAWALWALTSHLFLLVLHSNPLGWKATECCSLHYTVLQPALKTCWDKGLPKRQKSHYKKTNKQSSVEMMSSEQESYTSNISHQAQVSTTYIVSLLLSRIPCNCLAEIAVGLAQRNRCGLMRLTGFLK